MALIKCPECGKEISDKALSCPSCAYPIKPVVIEATGKKWKGLQLIFSIVFAVGFVWLITKACAIDESTSSEPSAIPVFMVIIGFLGYIISRIYAWWHHR